MSDNAQNDNRGPLPHWKMALLAGQSLDECEAGLKRLQDVGLMDTVIIDGQQYDRVRDADGWNVLKDISSIAKCKRWMADVLQEAAE